jgi:hypothetical protein
MSSCFGYALQNGFDEITGSKSQQPFKFYSTNYSVKILTWRKTGAKIHTDLHGWSVTSQKQATHSATNLSALIHAYSSKKVQVYARQIWWRSFSCSAHLGRLLNYSRSSQDTHGDQPNSLILSANLPDFAWATPVISTWDVFYVFDFD